MDLSKFYQKDGNPKVILEKIIKHRKRPSLANTKHQTRFPSGPLEGTPSGDQPLTSGIPGATGGGMASTVENASRKEEKFMAFLEGLKDEENKTMLETIKQGFESCLGAIKK